MSTFKATSFKTKNSQGLIGDVIDNSGTQGNLVVGLVAVEAKVGGSVLANRKAVVIIPIDGTVYWGFANTVSTSNGMPLFNKQPLTITTTDNVTVWLIAASSINVRLTEMA